MEGVFEILDVHPFLRPPSWRSLVARAAVGGGQPDDGDEAEVSTRDVWLSLALKDERRRKARTPRGGGAVERAVGDANALHANSRPGGWRWMIEALLCSGLSDAEIASELQLPTGRESVKAFRRIYFDVDCYRVGGELSRTALEANVMSASRNRAMTGTNHDYAWKRIAIRFGPSGFMAYIRGEHRPEHDDFIAQFAGSKNLEHALLFSESPAAVARAMGPEVVGGLMKIPEEFRGRRQKAAGDGAFDLELEDYFSRMIPLVEKAQRVVTAAPLMAGIEIDAGQGRGVQRITAGGAMLLPQGE